MPVVDLLFPAHAGMVPLDHGYLLFSALASRIPAIHQHREIGIFNLKGQSAVGESLQLGRGTLRIRCPAESIGLFLGLPGNSIELAGRPVVLGAPVVPLAVMPKGVEHMG